MSGLYKLENNELLHAEIAVYYPNGNVIHVSDVKQNGMIDGWMYFETEEEAKQHFNIQENA